MKTSETRWFKGIVVAPSERAFLLGAGLHYFPRYIYKMLFPSARTFQKVKLNYDNRRQEMLAKFIASKPPLEEYVFGKQEEKEFFLADDHIQYGRFELPKRYIMDAIERSLEPYLKADKGCIVEFGSGNGRNLLWLKSKYPKIDFIGLELSSLSIELSKAAAAFYNLDVIFFEANVCEKINIVLNNVDVCFSCHALEMMPRVFVGAVENMMVMARKEVLLFEPVIELYPHNMRGIVSKWRASSLDRLTGLLGYLKAKSVSLIEAKRLSTAGNPLNETCLLRIKMS